LPSTPRRTPGTQTPAGRASARRPTTGAAGGRPGAARASSNRSEPAPRREQGKGDGGRKPRSAFGRFAEAVRAGSQEARAAAPRSAPSRGRPTRRPGARRTAASRGTDRRFNRRSGGRFTGRAAIVAVVVSVLVLTLAYPLQEYLAQRSQLAAAEQEQAEQLGRIAGLEEQKRKWNDPAYVRAQASKRLQLVEPGVTVYKIKSDAEPAAEQPGPGGAVVGKASSKSPWYSQLWSSVQAADRPAEPNSDGATPADKPAK